MNANTICLTSTKKKEPISTMQGAMRQRARLDKRWKCYISILLSRCSNARRGTAPMYWVQYGPKQILNGTL